MIILFLVYFTATCCGRVAGHSDNALLLLVSFDGFRWDYLDKVKASGGKTPNFDSIINSGVTARYVQPSYTTKTFPNHYSIVTGMYEDKHGVIGNEMFDPVQNKSFDFFDKSPFWYNNGTDDPNAPQPEPIWLTNQRGYQTMFKRRSGVFFWPGSNVPLQGELPYHFKDYDGNVPNKTRIDTVIEWFSNDQDPINLGLLYFSEPDHTCHRVGPDDPLIVTLIQELDDLVGYMITKLKEHNLYHRLNIIITSDHGATKVPAGSVIVLENHLNMSTFNLEGDTVANIWPHQGQEEEVYEKLQAIPHLTVYKKESIPNQFHYKHNKRIAPIVIEADAGWIIVETSGEASSFNGTDRGTHGYNNSLSDMRSFFVAHGPAFKPGFVSQPFPNIDIYNLMCGILDIEPNLNDGSLETVQEMLKKHEEEEEGESLFKFTKTTLTYLGIAILGPTLSCIFCIAAHRGSKRKSRPVNGYSLPLAHVAEGRKPLLEDSEEEELP